MYDHDPVSDALANVDELDEMNAQEREEGKDMEVVVEEAVVVVEEEAVEDEVKMEVEVVEMDVVEVEMEVEGEEVMEVETEEVIAVDTLLSIASDLPSVHSPAQVELQPEHKTGKKTDMCCSCVRLHNIAAVRDRV